jgi:hypothetical protein
MGRRAWIMVSSEIVSHHARLEGVYATASRESDTLRMPEIEPPSVDQLRGARAADAVGQGRGDAAAYLPGTAEYLRL